MTTRIIKAFDETCQAVVAHEEKMTTAEYIEFLDEVRFFIAMRQQIVQQQIKESADDR